MNALQRFGAITCASRGANKSKTTVPVILWHIINIIITIILTNKVSADPSYIGMFSSKSEPRTSGLKVLSSKLLLLSGSSESFSFTSSSTKETFSSSVVCSPSWKYEMKNYACITFYFIFQIFLYSGRVIDIKTFRNQLLSSVWEYAKFISIIKDTKISKFVRLIFTFHAFGISFTGLFFWFLCSLWNEIHRSYFVIWNVSKKY